MKKAILLSFLFGSSLLLNAQNKKIIAPGMSAAAIKELQSVAPDVTILNVRGADLAREIVDADAILGGIRPELFRTAKKLKWVHVSSAGVEKDLFPELVDSDVVVTNAKLLYVRQLAEHAF